jgi:hypothetical protein
MKEDSRDELVPVKGHSNLFRDPNTGAIVNTDKNAYTNYIKMKQQRQNERNELDMIKSDIEEIKSLLKELTNGSRQN